MSVALTYIHYAFSVLVNLSLSCVLLIFLANQLDKTEFALFGVISASLGWLLVAFNAGHKDALFKYASANDVDRVLSLGASLLTWISKCLCLALPFMALAGATWSAAVLAFTSLLVLQCIGSVMRGRGDYKADGLLWPTYRFIWLMSLLVAYVSVSSLSLVDVFLSSFISVWLTLIVLRGGPILHSFLRGAVAATCAIKDPTLRRFMLIELAMIAYLKIDIILLSLLSIPADELASYVLGVHIFESASLLLAPVGYLYLNYINRYRLTSARASRFVVFLGMALGVASATFLAWLMIGPWLLRNLLPAFTDNFALTLGLLTALFPFSVSMLLMYRLISAHREASYASVCVLGFFTSLTLNLFLIPKFGTLGSVWARFATEVVILAALVVVFNRFKTFQRNP